MITRAGLLLCLAGAVFPCIAAAQQQNSTCTFADGKSVSVTYTPVEATKDLSAGHPWSPGEKHMLLFTEVPTQIAGTTIPIGAYSLYLIPGQKEWTLVVNRGVNDGANYDKSGDVVRAPMQIGILPSKEDRFSAYLGQTAPGQCSIRFDYGKTRAWIELQEK